MMRAIDQIIDNLDNLPTELGNPCFTSKDYTSVPFDKSYFSSFDPVRCRRKVAFIDGGSHVQDYAQLSGGERTSIALAYRLALNTIVREVSFDKPVDLLILDEPTEGFSKEQLFKLRGVLDKVDCAQIIIVSHEQELDGLVDQIYFVENNYGISCVKTSS
jgi:DNA repair exonuclease SbcCD ATPase subunit